MRKALVIALTLAVVPLAGPTLAGAGNAAVAKIYKLSATMNASQVVTVKSTPWKVPAAVAKAKGTFTGTVDTTTRKLTWRITYTGITRPVIVVADIHSGKPGRFGLLVTRVCDSCKSGQRGVKKLKASEVKTLTTGSTWITVKTEKYPNGVIRGQIKIG